MKNDRFSFGTLVAPNKDGTIRPARKKDSPVGIVVQNGNFLCKSSDGRDIPVARIGPTWVLLRQTTTHPLGELIHKEEQ